MKVLYEIQIPEQICDYIQSLYYEVNGARNLAAYALSALPDTFPSLKKEYMDLFKTYNLAMESLRREFVPSEYRDEHYTLEVRFGDNMLQVVEHNAR